MARSPILTPNGYVGHILREITDDEGTTIAISVLFGSGAKGRNVLLDVVQVPKPQ